MEALQDCVVGHCSSAANTLAHVGLAIAPFDLNDRPHGKLRVAISISTGAGAADCAAIILKSDGAISVAWSFPNVVFVGLSCLAVTPFGQHKAEPAGLCRT